MMPDNKYNFKKNKFQRLKNIKNVTNNNIIDSEIETFRSNKECENLNDENINVLREVFNGERKNSKKEDREDSSDIYNDDNLIEISKEINNPVIDKIIKYNKNNKNSNKSNFSINNELCLDESSSISIPPSIETSEPCIEYSINQKSKKLSFLNENSEHNIKKFNNESENLKKFLINITNDSDDNEKIINEINNLNNYNDNDNNNDNDNDNDNNNNNNNNNNGNNNDHEIKNNNNSNNNINININQINNNNNKPSEKNNKQNHNKIITNDFIKQNYMKRVSDQKAYWPSFKSINADPSSNKFTTSIQKKSPFSPYLQYLILLNKEINKLNNKEKYDQNNKNKSVGGYIVLNKDIKGSWTNTEIMRHIKKQHVVNNELNLLLPLKCVAYECSNLNKYIVKEKNMYYIRLYQKLDIENSPAYIDMIVENTNTEDTYDYTLLFTVPVEAFDMYICNNGNEINYHKAEIHIEHPNNQYDHFKISSIIGHSNIVEFIQKLRQCRGLEFDKNLPKSSEIKNYDKIKENEKKVKFLNNKQQMILKFQIQNKKEE